MLTGLRVEAPVQIASWLLFAVVALAPLPFGSNEPTDIAFWCIALGTCLVFASWQPLGSGQLALAGLACVVVVGYALVVWQQLSERPWLPGASFDPLWQEAESALQIPIQGSFSITRNQPWFELGRPLVCILAIACGFLVGADRDCARRLIKAIAWSGVAYASYGILERLFDPTHILWRDKEAYLPYLTATFINRNTAAAYFGSCAVVWSLLLWERLRLAMPPGPMQWRAVPARLFSKMPRKFVVAFAMLFLCLTVMFMTGSRGAVIISLGALIIGFVLFFRRHLPRKGGLVTVLAVASVVVFFLMQLMGGIVSERFDLQGLADEGRLETYKSTLRMIADHPWFGTGQGTFAAAFPAYRSPNISIFGVWDIAHNTLLEIAADMGVPIAALVVGAWIVVFVILIRGALLPNRDRVVCVAALAVASLAVMHSMIDFTLQIPGYSLVALSLIGAGLSQSFVANEGSGNGVRRGRGRRDGTLAVSQTYNQAPPYNQAPRLKQPELSKPA